MRRHNFISSLLATVLITTGCGACAPSESEPDTILRPACTTTADPSTSSSSSSTTLSDSSTAADSTTGSSCDQWISETFDGDLSSWVQLNPSTADVTVSAGLLSVVPHAWSLWYNQYGQDTVPAWQLYHQCDGVADVSGDFKVTADVVVSDVGGGGQAGTPWQFIGLQVRDPAATTVNAVQADVGSTGTGDFRPHGPNLGVVQQSVFEWKTTDDSVSSWNVSSSPAWTGAVQIRVCKVGSDFHILGNRGSGWIDFHSVTRTDLTGVPLAVGPISYAYTGAPDVAGTFSQLVIEPATSVADCSL